MPVQETAIDANFLAKAIRLGPPVEERVSLKDAPSESAVEFYFLTDAASRAWTAISASLASGKGAVFWIAGPAGAGKTHFLNYLLALEQKTARARGRCSVFRLEIDSRAGAYDLEQRMFDSLAREIGVGDAGATLWRRLHGAEALGLALEQASRVGIRAITIAIDFGAADASAWNSYFAEMTQAAKSSRNVTLEVFVAARTRAPEYCFALEVGPADGEERVSAALARARRIADPSAAAEFRAGADFSGFDPRAIFPFKPWALQALRTIAGEAATVADLAGLSRGALAEWIESGGEAGLSALDVVRSAAAANLIEIRLGGTGRAARRIAYRAADALEESLLAREIVDLLLLQWLGNGERPVSIPELRASLADIRTNFAAADARIAAIVEAVAARSGGVIDFSRGEPRFNPHAAGAPEVAAYNDALSLLRHFDSTLVEARDASDLEARLARASEAMARAVEEAHRELRLELKAEHRRAFDDFIALAGAGPAAVIGQALDPEYRIRAKRVAVEFELIAAAAAAIPRIREMREYLRAAELTPGMTRDDPGVERPVAAAQVECQLLLSALESGVARWEPRGFDALEIRCHKFKWNYIQLYQSAHERWRREGERFGVELAAAREHFAALARLNAIHALGAPAGADLGVRIEHLAAGHVRCTSDAPLTLDVAPRCARCSFVLGTVPRRSELAETLEQIKRALKVKLSALSQDAIARLIREHDRGRRLDGFLKITQAAQTDALVRVLDENLAQYLLQMLEDLRGEPKAAARRVLQPVMRADREISRSGGKRAARPIKPRPD